MITTVPEWWLAVGGNVWALIIFLWIVSMYLESQ